MDQDIRICFVGDSFVNGTGDETALGWAGRLCAAAQAKGRSITYYNFGIRRDTSRDILHRWEDECVRRLPASVDGRVVLSFGVNDTVVEHGAQRIATEESVGNARAILQGVRARYKVLLVGPPPIVEAAHNVRIQALPDAFANLARNLRLPYIPTFPFLLPNEQYQEEVRANDGTHPQSSGYAELAKIISASPQWWFSDTR